ncbi:MAG: tetratricopeptide repeat protein [Pseudomonadota bacterium]
MTWNHFLCTALLTTNFFTSLASSVALAGLPPAKLLPKYQPSASPPAPASRHSEETAQTHHVRSDIQALQSQNAQLQNQIRALSRQLNESVQIHGQQSEAKHNPAGVQEKIARLQSENHSLRTHIQELTGKVNSIQVASTKGSTPETQQVIRKQQQQIRILEEHNKVLQKQLNELEARFTQIQTRSRQNLRPAVFAEKDYDGKLQKLQTQNDQLNTHFQTLSIRLNKMDGKRAAIAPQTIAFNATQEQALTQLNSQVETLQSQLRTLTGQIEVMNHKIRTLEGKSNAGKSNESKLSTTKSDGLGTPATPVTQSLTKQLLAQKKESTLAVKGGSLPSGQALEAYNQAITLLNKREFDLAQRALHDFIVQYPTNPLVVNAQYWLAETYYIRRDYQQAALGFSAAYKKYQKYKQKGHQGQSAVKAPEILLKLALSLKEMGNKGDASITLDQLENEFPKAPQNIKRQVHAARLELRSRG